MPYFFIGLVPTVRDSQLGHTSARNFTSDLLKSGMMKLGLPPVAQAQSTTERQSNTTKRQER